MTLTLIPIISWVSLFTLIWLLIVGVVDPGAGNTAALIFFFIIALFSSSLAYATKYGKTE